MRFILSVLGFEIVLATLLFGVAGRIDLPWFWALLAIHASLVLTAAASVDPDLRAERLHPGGDGGIDRGFRPMLALFLIVHLIVAALDAGRFHWSPLAPAPVRAIALLIYTAGVVLSLRALAVNRFFS